MRNDLLADTLSRIQNGWLRKLPKIQVPDTKFVNSCLVFLQNHNCIGKLESGDKYLQTLHLVYDKTTGAPLYDGFKKLSKCSLRKYSDVSELRKLTYRFPQNLYVLSTNVGILSAKEAIEKNVGGELLFVVRR